jgi:hypothetical protein
MSDSLFSKIEELLNSGIGELLEEVIPCSRCGMLCKLSPKPNSEARVAKRADETKDGLCINCSVTSFIMSVETLNHIINIKGADVLLNEAARSQFSEIMLTGKSDADPSEINWDAVVKNWGLPFKKTRGRKKRG